MPRYKLRTLMVVLAIGPMVLAWAWLNRVPLGISLALVLSACILGTVLGRTLLWGIEGLLAIAGCLLATLRQAMRHKMPDSEDEFSLSRFATELKARRKE